MYAGSSVPVSRALRGPPRGGSGVRGTALESPGASTRACIMLSRVVPRLGVFGSGPVRYPPASMLLPSGTGRGRSGCGPYRLA